MKTIKIIFVLFLVINIASCAPEANNNNSGDNIETDWVTYYANLENLYKDTVTIDATNIELSDGNWSQETYSFVNITYEDCIYTKKDIKQLKWQVNNPNCLCVEVYNEDNMHYQFFEETNESVIQKYYSDALLWAAEINDEPNRRTGVYLKDNLLITFTGANYKDSTGLEETTIEDFNYYRPQEYNTFSIKRNPEKTVYIVILTYTTEEGDVITQYDFFIKQ